MAGNKPHSGSASRIVVYCVTMAALMLYRFGQEAAESQGPCVYSREFPGIL
jgi:hypothetical protein